MTGQTLVYSFDPITGLPIEGMAGAGKELPFALKQVTMLQQMSDAFVRPVLMMDEQLNVSVKWGYFEKGSIMVLNVFHVFISM